MRRGLLVSATATLLLLFFGNVILWVRSYNLTTQWSLHWREHDYQVFSRSGQIGIDNESEWRRAVGEYNAKFQKALNRSNSRTRAERREGKAELITIRAARPTVQFVQHTIRYVWLAVPLAIGVIVGLVMIVNIWRRPEAETCPKCRYNLTGNTGGVFPECGAPIQQKAEVRT